MLGPPPGSIKGRADGDETSFDGVDRDQDMLASHVRRQLTCRLSAFTRLDKGLRHLSSAVAKPKSRQVKTVTSFDLLPTRRLDLEGRPAQPLPPRLDETKARGKSSRPSDNKPSVARTEDPLGEQDDDVDALWRRAVLNREVPDTPLAKEIYINYRRFPGCIVLTRVGKFYESYFAPAVQLSSLLSLKLAYRRYTDGNWPFSGFPVPQLDKYLKILVQDLLQTVVLVEEYGHRDSTGNIVGSNNELKERKVGRVVTPGTLIDEGWFSSAESRYLLSIAVADITPDTSDQQQVPLFLAYTDVSTGEIFSKESSSDQLENDLARIAPREVVLNQALKPAVSGKGMPDSSMNFLIDPLRAANIYVSFANPFPDPEDPASVSSVVHSTEISGIEAMAFAQLRHHLQYALRETMPMMTQPHREKGTSTMQIDAATLHALEIRHSIRPGAPLDDPFTVPGRIGSPLSSRGTLLSVIDRTKTPAGHRLLVRTLTAPSTDIAMINARLSLVQAFVDQEDLRLELQEAIKGIADIMKVIQRLRGRRGDGREVWDVAKWIRSVEGLLKRVQEETRLLSQDSSQLQRLEQLLASFRLVSELADKIEASVDEEAVVRSATSLSEDGEDGESDVSPGDVLMGGRRPGETKKEAQERRAAELDAMRWWIRPSFSPLLAEKTAHLDRLRDERRVLEERLRRRIGSDKVFLSKSLKSGYHVAVTSKEIYVRADKSRTFETLSETKGQKTYAYGPWSALGSRTEAAVEELWRAQRIAAEELQQLVVDRAEDIQHNAQLVNEMDLTLGFAQAAVDLDFVRPVLLDDASLNVINGRHPAVESGLLASARSFTPNSTMMSQESRLHIITGPNQGGKSTLLRQTAVIAILAQSGCFVPADKAEIGIVDKMFSRIGARDDLFRDRSTFMLEMVETAAILRHATPRSLVIMDEIGRGTTLNAGISIAFATLQYILKNIQCRTLFATHYHELAAMLNKNGKDLPGISFWCTDVDDSDGAFSYRYKLHPGINSNSHAIRAAQLAGMPQPFLDVAQGTLDKLNNKLAIPE